MNQDHPMAYNINTRIRWEAISRLPEIRNLKNKRVLDVGCGLGFFSLAFHEASANVVGIDLDRHAIRHLQNEYGIDALPCDIEHDAIPGMEWDVIYCGEVLEHLGNPATFYEKAFGALKPGGVLVLTTPALEGVLTLSPGKRMGHDHGGQKHERDGFTHSELVSMAESSGFEYVSHEYCLFLVSEIFMQLTKLGYLRFKRGYDSQSDVLNLTRSTSFRVLRMVFPLVWMAARVENFICRTLDLKGHCHVQVVRRPSA